MEPFEDDLGCRLLSDISLLIQAVREDPENSLHWRTLADRYHEDHYYYESALYYREAWRLNPSDVANKVSMSNLYFF